MHCVRERLFSNFVFFGKQPIENKPYFYKSFPLTKDSFPLTNYFLCYQILDNMKNYLYRKFSSETNSVSYVIKVHQSSFNDVASKECHHILTFLFPGLLIYHRPSTNDRQVSWD